MESLETIRERLEIYFTDISRKVWVQRCARGNDVMLTCFHQNREGYRIISLKNLKTISFDEIVSKLN